MQVPVASQFPQNKGRPGTLSLILQPTGCSLLVGTEGTGAARELQDAPASPTSEPGDLSMSQHRHMATQDDSFETSSSHRKPTLGKGVQRVRWGETSRHAHTPTPSKGAPTRITLFARKSSLATYKSTVVITENTGIANHTTSGASALLSQRDSSEGFPREQRAVLTCSCTVMS